ncbi:MAG: carbohydrate ABC transporter permease, partial [Oceanibaculum sp.]
YVPKMPLWERLVPYGLAVPALALLLLLILLPSFAVILLSLTDWQFGARSLNFIGLGNYEELLQDRVFRRSILNTLIYVGVVMPASVFLGLGIAMLIESGTRGRAFFRAAYFLPVASTFVAMATVWQFMLHPSLGSVNQFLWLFGIRGPDWLSDSNTVLLTLSAIGIWETLGFNMVLFLAGLKSIPRDLYDATDVDGGHRFWDRFMTVTWPLLGPTTMFVIVITAIRSFRVFESVAVMTQGGPGNASQVLLYTMYTEGFQFFRSGYASAITVVFLAFVLLLTLIQVKVIERRVHYS